MDVYEALYTTRAMRRVRPDPIPMDIQAKILDAAIRAPSGGNTQDWRFLLVDDPDIKAQIGPLYRDCMDKLWSTIYAERIAKADADPDSEESRDTHSMVKSAQHLGDHFEGDRRVHLPGHLERPTGGKSRRRRQRLDEHPRRVPPGRDRADPRGSPG
jgi:nitroreductase